MKGKAPEMKKPQRLDHAGASEDNVKPEQEMNVMSKNSTAAAQIVPFRQAKLLLVDRGGEPFVPMKPVVEGMGLSWASQTVKLNGNQARWGVSIIEIPSSSGIQSYLCIPLRKLFGWMNTIHPSKVRKDLREDIIAYQNECDDVLWSYWNEGRAVRNDDRTVETVLNSTIGTDGFHMLGAIIKGKVVSLPQAVQRRATAKIWSQTHAAFGVRSAADIPADQLDAARNFIAAYAIEGEFLPKQEESARHLDIHFPVSRWLKDCPSFARVQEMEAPGRLLISPRMLYGMDFLSPTLRLINDLARAGYNVEACKLETMAARDLVRRLSSDLCEIQRLCGVSLQQGIRFQVAKEVAA